MTANSFEITPSNVKCRIDDADVSTVDGHVDIKFSIKDVREENAQINSAQFKFGTTGSWQNMALDATAGKIKSQDIATTDDWVIHLMTWKAYDDVDLNEHDDVYIRVKMQDSEGTSGNYQEHGPIVLDFTPTIETYYLPEEFTKDDTPYIEFLIPSAFYPANMHFEIKIATALNKAETALDDDSIVLTIDSSLSRTNWMFQIEEYGASGTYFAMKTIGCPSVDALNPLARCRHEIVDADALDDDVYYFTITAKAVTKKIPTDELDLPAGQMTGYPVNY